MKDLARRGLALLLAVVMCIGSTGCGTTFNAAEDVEEEYVEVTEADNTQEVTEEIVVQSEPEPVIEEKPETEEPGSDLGTSEGEPTTEPVTEKKSEPVTEESAPELAMTMTAMTLEPVEPAEDVLTVIYVNGNGEEQGRANFTIDADHKVSIAAIAASAPYGTVNESSFNGPSIDAGSLLIGDWFTDRVINAVLVEEKPVTDETPDEGTKNILTVVYLDNGDSELGRKTFEIVDGKVSVAAIKDAAAIYGGNVTPGSFEGVNEEGDCLVFGEGVNPTIKVYVRGNATPAEDKELHYSIVYKAEGVAEALETVEKTATVAADEGSYTLDNKKDIDAKERGEYVTKAGVTHPKYVIKDGELDKVRTVEEGGSTEVLYREKNFEEKLTDYADDVLKDGEPRALVSLKKTTPGSEFKAGQSVEYKLQYQFSEIPVWGGGQGIDNDQPIFASYDTEVSFTLPDGMRLEGVYEGFVIKSSTVNEDGSTTYTAEVKQCQSGADGGTIKVYLAGNGTEESIRSFGNLKAELNYDMELVDRQTGKTFGKVYNQHVEATAQGVTTVTDDVWGIKKVLDDAATIDRTNMTMTVEYTVSLGLMRRNESGQLVMIESLSDYNRDGRVPVKNMSLNEALTATLLDPAGNPKDVTVELQQVTIKNTSKGSSLAFNNNEKIDIIKTDPQTGAVTGLDLNTIKIKSDYDYDAKSETVDVDVPVFSQYKVTAVYKLTDEMIAQYYEKENSIAYSNKATLNDYELAGITDLQPGSYAEAGDSGELWLKNPVKLNIEKTLKTYKGQSIGYKGSTQEGIYGEIGYTLSSETPFSVYRYDAATKTYTCISGAAKVTSFAVNDDTTYYLDPGIAYTVAEDLTADQSKFMALDSNDSKNLTKTPVANEEWKAKVVNQETAADISIVKKDNTSIAVSGAEFTLYSKDAQGEYTVEYGKVTTAADGKAGFVKVPYGEYKLVETAAPQGYAITWEGEELNINKTTTVALDVVNERTAADVRLTKWIGVAEPRASIKTKANSSYAGTFTLQRSIDNGINWETVEKDIYGQAISAKVDSNGNITARVPAKDANKKVYLYRFVEDERSLPAGYYAPYGFESEAKTLLTDSGTIVTGAVNLDLVNRRSVDVTATKEFYKISSNKGAIAIESGKTTTAQLYSYKGTLPETADGLTAVGDAQTVGTYTWTKLPLYDGDDEIHYLIKETAVENYRLDGTPVVIEEEEYVAVPVNTISGNSISVTMKNVEQVVPAVITKQNSYTGAFVPGSKVTVYDKEGNVAVDARSGNSMENVEIPEGGLTVWLRPGQTYSFKETGVPAKYTLESYIPEKGTMDMKNAQTSTSHYAATGVVVNRPYPDVRIKKVDSLNTNQTVSGAVYTVYEKINDVYTPVTENGKAVTISGNGSKTEARLQPGKTYYFAETTVPSGYLDPNAEWVYTRFLSNNATYERGTVDGTTYTFAKGEVTDMVKNKTNDNVCRFTFSNIKNSGEISVKKYIDGVLAEGVPGFPVEFRSGDPSTLAKSAQTENNGIVKVSLPVYDAEGNKIIYTVKEGELSDDQKEIYYKVDESASQQAELELGKIVSTDISEEPQELRIDNATLVQIQTTKVRVNTWEYDFTGIAYLMPGVKVGLYQKQADESWKLLETGLTGGMGSLTFESKLRRDGEYAVVEISAPSYYRMFPDGGKKYAVDENGEELETISKEDLSEYNANIVGAEKLEQINSEKIIDAGWLWNRNHWVQFDITKWKDADPLSDTLTVDSNPAPAVDKEHDERYDNAVFELYRYIVPEGQTELTFDPETWTLIGKYTSGTEYSDTDDSRMSGQFRTDIDQGVDESYVYVLVETNAGPGGAEMYNYYKQTFYRAEHTSYTCAGISRTVDYQLDRVNEDDILNATPSGPGSGEPMLASLRLSKWATEFNEFGVAGTNYTPLPNAKFELRLPDGTVIATLTSGLDATKKEGEEEGKTIADKAWAQSGVYLLKEGKTEGTWDLVDYENDQTTYENVAVEVLNESTKESDGYTVYGIKTKLFEVEAPEDYGYSLTGCDMYLSFVEKLKADGKRASTWYFNDAYFVKTATEDVGLSENQKGTAWYLTDAKDESTSAIGGPQWRIVDYKTKNSAVMLTKYGYLPTEQTLGKTSAELDGMNIPSRMPLAGIEMLIERLKDDGSRWEYWDYKGSKSATDARQAKFTTGANGSFVFPDGLPMGNYRVYESNLGDYAASYENAYPDGSHAREFYVGGQTVQVTMYNPEKVDLTIIKSSTDGTFLKNAKFTLTAKTSGLSNLSKTTDANGKATFTNIASGSYKLSETAPSGYTNAYLAKYLNTTDYKALVSTNGALIGYNYVSKEVTKDGNVIGKDNSVSTIGLTGTSLELPIVNPNTVVLNIGKKDEQTDDPLVGAKFKMYYKAFDRWSGEMKVTDAASAVSKWTYKAEQTTGNNGLATFSNKYAPGIYAFVESEAPAGYDIIKDKDGKDVIFYIVATGGMSVTVTGLPEKAVIKDVEGKDNEIPVTFIYTGNSAQITVNNREKVKVSATKDVTFGQIPSDKAENYNWSVRLDLYDAASGGNVVATASISSTDSSKTAAFKDAQGNERVLSLNGTYYLQETVTSSPASDYAPILVTKDGTTIAANEAGRYEITAASLNDIALAVKNQYKRGQVTFIKYDGEKDAAEASNWLSGAKFEVRYEKDGSWVNVPGSSVSEVIVDVNGTNRSKYVADIPLLTDTPAATKEYRIYETEAAPHYLKDENSYVSAVLSWDDNVKEFDIGLDGPNGYKIPNTRGDVITVRKFGNIASAESKPELTGGVQFWLVKLNEADKVWETVENHADDLTEGGISYLVVPGATYGIIEYRGGSDYHGIDKVFANKNEIIPGEADSITIGEESFAVYSLGLLASHADDIAVEVYNNPKLSVKVIKKDVGGYPQGVIPSASYSIYEIPENFNESDRSAVEAIVSTKNPVHTGTTATVDGATTTDTWKGIDAYKRYLVVETKVANSGATTALGAYDTLNKDDKRVVWYGVIEPTDNPNLTNPSTVTLENVYGEATAGISKTGTEKIDSLLLGDQELVYEIVPTAGSNNQALSSYVLKDEGLSFTYKDYGDKPAEQKPVEHEITKLSLEPSKQNFAYFKDEISNALTEAHITETIKFFDADGVQTGDEIVRYADTVTQEIDEVPEGARSFTVEYSCKELYDLTAELSEAGEKIPGTGYGLGYGFTPGKITLEVTVKAQTDGTKDKPIAELAKITNKADVDLSYPKWADDGSGKTAVTSHADATAETTVTSVERPRIRVAKDSDPAKEVIPGQKVTYTITISNLGKKWGGPDVDFENPVVLDMLPSGFSFDPDAPVTVSEGLTCNKVSRFTGKAIEELAEDEDNTVVGNAETAVSFELTGTIKAGQSATVTFGTVASETLFLYGTTAENCVYVSSSEYSYHTGDNPNGYSFENDVGVFAELLKDAAKNLDATAEAREGALADAVGKYETDEYVWVRTNKTLELTQGTQVTLVKAVRGDKDKAFSEDMEFLGSATRTNTTPGIETDGYVDYRLTVFNGSEKMKGLVVGDVLPSYNRDDGRGSKWDAVMNSITSVNVNGSDVTDYTVYYYTGSNAPAALETAMAEDGHSADALAAAGWTTAADMTAITAFAVVFGKDVELDHNGYIVMTYHTLTETINDDATFTSRAAFENAMNTFRFYGDEMLAPATSNTVSVTLLDKNVEVGGDVWIDEDWDSTQQKTGNRRDYSEYAIINQLKSGIAVTLTDERRSGGETYSPDNEGRDSVGESILHYHFGGLNAATYVPGKAELYVNNELNTKALKTTDPFNYSMDAVVGSDELNKIFVLTGQGAEHYVSDDPDNIPEANALDSNFAGEDGSYSMKPFYLRYSNLTDNSKDIGFRMYRDLLIEKVNSSDPTQKVAGVKFKVYGPFEENGAPKTVDALGEPLKFTAVTDEEGTLSYQLTDDGTVTELPTDANGKLLITDLNWWKEYVIEEVEPAKGYSLKGAKATGGDDDTLIVPMQSENNKPVDGHWIFKLPGTGKLNRDNDVVISNRKLGHIRISKTLDALKGDTLNTVFVFDVKVTMDGKTVYADVVSINFTAAGTKSIDITNLPVGADVEIREVYAGNEYTQTSGPAVAIGKVPEPGEELEFAVKFENSYNNRITSSGGVINHFEDNGNGGWNWTKLNENTGPIYAIPEDEPPADNGTDNQPEPPEENGSEEQ